MFGGLFLKFPTMNRPDAPFTDALDNFTRHHRFTRSGRTTEDRIESGEECFAHLIDGGSLVVAEDHSALASGLIGADFTAARI